MVELVDHEIFDEVSNFPFSVSDGDGSCMMWGMLAGATQALIESGNVWEEHA